MDKEKVSQASVWSSKLTDLFCDNFFEEPEDNFHYVRKNNIRDMLDTMRIVIAFQET